LQKILSKKKKFYGRKRSLKWYENFCSKLTLTIFGAMEETPTFFGVLDLDKENGCAPICGLLDKLLISG